MDGSDDYCEMQRKAAEAQREADASVAKGVKEFQDNVARGHEKWHQDQAEKSARWESEAAEKERAHQARHASVREMEQDKRMSEYWGKKWERQNKRWSHGRETTRGPSSGGELSPLGGLISIAIFGLVVIFVVTHPTFFGTQTQGSAPTIHTPSDTAPAGFRHNPAVGHGRTLFPKSTACNAGNYAPDAGTLHLFAPEINRETREIVLNGVDTAPNDPVPI